MFVSVCEDSLESGGRLSFCRHIMFVSLCEDSLESGGRPKKDSLTFVPRMLVHLSSYGHSFPKLHFFLFKPKLLGWLGRHDVWSAAVFLSVVVLDTWRQVFALEILTFLLR
jgi:hypothetical protein